MYLVEVYLLNAQPIHASRQCSLKLIISEIGPVDLSGHDKLVPANIAEGFKKRTPREKVRILNIAQGSLEESRYYLILAKDLSYADTGVFLPKLEEVSRMLGPTFEPSKSIIEFVDNNPHLTLLR